MYIKYICFHGTMAHLPTFKMRGKLKVKKKNNNHIIVADLITALLESDIQVVIYEMKTNSIQLHHLHPNYRYIGRALG